MHHKLVSIAGSSFRGISSALSCAVVFGALLLGVVTVSAVVPVTAQFNLSDASDPLWSPREVNLKDGTVLQSFAFDNTHQFIYTVQVTAGSAATTGNLTVTKLSWDGQTVVSYMHLTGFGHGVQIGVEPSGADTYLWTETDSVSDGTNAWGNKICRFKFVNAATLSHTSASVVKYNLVSGATNATCNVDMVNGYLFLRYKTDRFHYALYSLAAVKAWSGTGTPPAPLCGPWNQPADLAGDFQGFTSYGNYVYILSGNAYDSGTNPPPGNTTIAVEDLNTGLEVGTPTPTNAGTTLTYREPEGMAIWTSGTTRRLCFGFATGTTSGSRQASIYYKDALVGP